MLLELKVQNLAIIESIEIHFAPGLNVLTGETGAGKSILLAALDLLLGGRSDKDLIRTGKEEAWAQATFEIEENLLPLLKKLDLPCDRQEPLSIRRVIQSNGRSRSYINCVSVPASVLKQIAPYLLDFGRQHEQSILLSPEKHLELLDRYGTLGKQRNEVQESYEKVKKLVQEYEELRSQISYRADRTAFLQFQLNGILEVDPQEGEEEELNTELKRLTSMEERRKLAQQAIHGLYAGEDSVRENLVHSIALVKKLATIDSSLSHVLEDLDNSLISIEEAASTLQTYRQNMRLDSEKIKDIQSRLDEIIALQHRYGGSYEAMMARRREMEKELKTLEEKEKKLQKLGPYIEQSKAQLYKLALPLSQKRREIAKNLSVQICSELADLAMEQAKFETRFSEFASQENAGIVYTDPEKPGQINTIGPYGLEQATFWMSANVGEELRPLQNVASGGELSRILLALKHVLSKVLSVQTFVFDEIDSGVSGTAAALIAQKLRDIIQKGQNSVQIISISHTPQIAATADCHFYVEKQTKENRTITVVHSLSYEERVKEIARMLSGGRSQEAALELSRQMVKKVEL